MKEACEKLGLRYLPGFKVKPFHMLHSVGLTSAKKFILFNDDQIQTIRDNLADLLRVLRDTDDKNFLEFPIKEALNEERK